MAQLSDIKVSSLVNESPELQIESIVSQINEWGRLLSNEDLTTVYNDTTGTPRIIIGILPDQTSGIVISKPGISVLDVFN